GEVEKVALNYDKNKVDGDTVRAKFGEKLAPQGFEQLSECVSPDGTSSAVFAGKDQAVYQIVVNTLGDDMYDVELQRAKRLPEVGLANPEVCKFLAAADRLCASKTDGRCTLK
ncbi:MAG: hypothetical protein AAGA56_04840, partial [Myxococcota bacterium]